MIRISEEDRLLLKLADPELAPDSLQTRKSVGWDVIMHKAQVHGVSSIAYLNLRKIGSSQIPSVVLAKMSQAYETTALRSLFILNQLQEIIKGFEGKGIKTTLLRGPAIGVTLYPQPAMRPFDDIDLLLEKKDIKPAKEILKKLGYQLFFPEKEDYDYTYRGELEFVKSACMTMSLELHWDIINSRSLRTRTHLEAKDFKKPLLPLELDGMHVLILSPEDLMLSLCAHIAYSHQYLKLIGLCDILQLSRRHLRVDFDWNYFLDRTRELEINIATYYAVFLCKDLLGMEIADRMMYDILPNRRLQKLCSIVLPPRLVVKNSLFFAKFSRKLFREVLKRL